MLPDSDRDDSAAEAKAGGLVVAPKQMSSALGSLMSNYGSMTESDEEPEGTEDAHLIPYVQYLHDPPLSCFSHPHSESQRPGPRKPGSPKRIAA